MISKANWTDFSSVDGGAALATINRVLPPWVSLLLVVVIAWQLAKIIWILVPAPATGDAVEAPVGVSLATAGGGPAADVQAIADKHMFGQADAVAAPVPTPEIDDNLSDTRLTNLVLKGTIASDVPEFSVAVIADGTAEQRVYAIGDSVGSGATLHAVYRDRVVLNENGALTNLRLPVDFPAAAATTVRRTTTTRQTATDDDASSLQNVLTQNLTQLSDVIRPTPYLVNGEQAGYRVYPGRNRQQFAALGLRPGDLIKDIDGQSLTDPTQAMQIFQSLGSTDQVTVTVERNGQPETIVLKTSQLDLDEESTQ
jgi:general secretion pathway protein C